MIPAPEVSGWISVVRAGQPGPWHAVNGRHHQALSWCGKRLKAFNVRHSTERPEGTRVCEACDKAIRANKPKAYRRR